MVADAVRVLLVDDHPAVRHGLEAMLESEPDLQPVGAAAASRDALRMAGDTRPEVVLIDYHLPDEDGLWLCQRLKALESPPRVLMYTAFADDTLALLALVCGVDGLVGKDALADELCDAVRAVADGQTRVPRPAPATMESALSGLEADDLPIVGMLMHGTPENEIAATLDLEEEWLGARRWAITERIRGRRART